MAEADIMTPVAPQIKAAPKARMTIYVVLLILSLVAILVGCLFLYLEIRAQGGFGTVQGQLSAIERPAQVLVVKTASAQLPPLG